MVDAEDGLPIDDVGAWVKEKHERLRQYVDITRAVRRRFVEGTGGATYIDLYCGSARARVRDFAEIIDGSPLVAAKTARDGGAPFSNIFIADASEALCRAAEERIVRAGFSPTVEVGTAEETVGRIVKKLSPYGLHFVFLDPFNLQDLPFSVITALARLKRVDLLMHVSAQDLQRNLHSYTRPGDNRLDRFAPGWRSAVDIQRPPRVVRAGLLEYWAKKIEALGLPPARHAELISGTSKNQRLYWLVLAARHDLARQLWDKIRNPQRQGDLF